MGCDSVKSRAGNAPASCGEPVSPERSIFRVGARDNPYSQLSNAALRDSRLAWEARALLCFILSHPPNWEFSFDWLRKQEPVIGRDRLRRLIEQLVDNGYCVRGRERDKSGAFGPYAYVFTDEPNHLLKTSNWLPVTGGQSVTTKRVTKENHKDRSSKSRGDDEKPRAAVIPRYVTEAALDRVAKLAPGWDRQFLLRKFLEWPPSANAVDLDKAFLGWVPKFTKGKSPGGAL